MYRIEAKTEATFQKVISVTFINVVHGRFGYQIEAKDTFANIWKCAYTRMDIYPFQFPLSYSEPNIHISSKIPPCFEG